MTDAESRALGRAATLLLVASLLRWGWSRAVADGPPPAVQGPDQAPELLEESRARAADARDRARPLGEGERLDPNRASAADLDRLPGVGAATARAIVASRQEDGPFLKPEDLARVRGVGEVMVRRIRGHLDLSHPPPLKLGQVRRQPARGPSPVDVNRADAAELQALPGVGPALAGRILEERRLRRFTSPDDLLRVKGIGPATLRRLRDRITVGR